MSFYRTFKNLSKTIRQDENVGSNSSLYSDTKKENFFKRKKKREHAFKGFASSYNKF